IADVKGAKDVALISNKKSFAVTDHNVVELVRATLLKAGVNVYKDLPTDEIPARLHVAETNLVVLTGHKADNFRTYIERLTDAGALRDKVVAVFSCYERGDEAFNSRVLAHGAGAKAVLFYTERINAEAVADVLKQFAKELANNPQGVDLKVL